MGSRLIGALALAAATFLAGCAKGEEGVSNVPSIASPTASKDAAGSPGKSAPKEDLQLNPGAGKIAEPGTKAGG